MRAHEHVRLRDAAAGPAARAVGARGAALGADRPVAVHSPDAEPVRAVLILLTGGTEGGVAAAATAEQEGAREQEEDKEVGRASHAPG